MSFSPSLSGSLVLEWCVGPGQSSAEVIQYVRLLCEYFNFFDFPSKYKSVQLVQLLSHFQICHKMTVCIDNSMTEFVYLSVRTQFESFDVVLLMSGFRFSVCCFCVPKIHYSDIVRS